MGQQYAEAARARLRLWVDRGWPLGHGLSIDAGACRSVHVTTAVGVVCQRLKSCAETIDQERAVAVCEALVQVTWKWRKEGTGQADDR
jgi:hypothetical protein